MSALIMECLWCDAVISITGDDGDGVVTTAAGVCEVCQVDPPCAG